MHLLVFNMSKDKSPSKESIFCIVGKNAGVEMSLPLFALKHLKPNVIKSVQEIMQNHVEDPLE